MTINEHIKQGLDGGEITLDDAKKILLENIKQSTNEYVTVYMPNWKYTQWLRYQELHEKILAGDTLSPLNFAIYSGFPDSSESNQDAYDRCVAGLSWILMCIAANDVIEAAILAMKSSDDLLTIPEPQYPVWPL